MAESIDVTQYACTNKKADQIFGKIACSDFSKDSEKTLSETVSVYIYGYMKGIPLSFQGEDFCRMRNPNGSPTQLKTPLCSYADLERGNKNTFGESCGGSTCKFDSHGMKQSTCEVENTLDRGAIIEIALSKLSQTVGKMGSGSINVSSGCESFSKDLKQARTDLDKLEKEFIEKYKLDPNAIATEKLKTVCSKDNPDGKDLNMHTFGNLPASGIHAICGFVMLETYIRFFVTRVGKCELFAGIAKDYNDYLFKSLKTYGMFTDQLEEVCIDVETANRSNPEDDDNGDTKTITAQQCYDSGTGYDNKQRDRRSADFFKGAFPFDQKYLQLIKGPSADMDKVASLPLCGGLIGAGFFGRRRRKNGRVNKFISAIKNSLLLAIASFIFLMPQTSFAKRAKAAWDRPDTTAHTFTCSNGSEVSLSLAQLAADPAVNGIKNEHGVPYIKALDELDYMWDQMEQYFYCRQQIQCNHGDFKRFFRKGKMLHAIASKCKIKRGKVKAEIMPMWDARKSCSNTEPFINLNAGRYSMSSIRNTGNCTQDYDSGEKHGVKKAKKRAGEAYRAEAAQACVNMMSFAGYTRKTNKKEGATAIKNSEEGFKVFWADVQNTIAKNPNFCPQQVKPDPPTSDGSNLSNFGAGLNNTAALGGLPQDDKYNKNQNPNSGQSAAATAGESGFNKKMSKDGKSEGPAMSKGPKFAGALGSGGGAGSGGIGGSQSSDGSSNQGNESAITGAPTDDANKDGVTFEAAKNGGGAGGKRGMGWDTIGGANGVTGVGFGNQGADSGAGGDVEDYLKMDPSMTLFERVNRAYYKKNDQLN